eukprot:963112-Alexandrium_andersonii.AAC.1
MWTLGFQRSVSRGEWVPTPAGVLMRALPALMTQDGRGGHLWPSAVARVIGPTQRNAALGWTPPEVPPPALPTGRPRVATWAGLLAAPP